MKVVRMTSSASIVLSEPSGRSGDGRGLLQDGALVQAQRRQRVVATARRFEHVAAVNLLSLQVAGLAGDAELVLGALVIGLEVGVAQRPVGERGVFRNGGCAVTRDRMRARAEVVLVQAP